MIAGLKENRTPVSFQKGSMWSRVAVVAFLCIMTAAAISHEAEGSGIGSLYPEGWRMVDRFAGFRYECTRKGKLMVFAVARVYLRVCSPFSCNFVQ